MERKWTPLHPHNNFEFTVGRYALSILNQDISIPPQKMTLLWNKAEVRSIVDGATDRWFAYVREKKLKIRNKFPEIISGDFDTISPNTLKLCRHNGVHIEKTSDESFSDFHKSLQVVGEVYRRKLDSVLIICNNSGRLDHIFSNLNTLNIMSLFFMQETPPNAFLISEESLTWHLHRGFHKIYIPKYLIENNEWCAILPFEPKISSVTTTGLKWDLQNTSIHFGGLVCSSNSYIGLPHVTIATDAELLWSMGINTPPKIGVKK
ncbi:thiamin pyrophosphokinase 1 [Cimex lectularius]|uniref:Thiamin pyrophosphokinase thiamin-binding domain-containing protein n=1 Tax=Cimex lectularius TaxID=79782 RepID=A0A8I6RHU1_CIMLE|nr:thiamin pyrophosphokinase 1 [Cimex lectularius]XP_014245636.1 thiamin pyrophosphokinase 1 [Cimex lectularius]